ncbi:MAG: spermidine synthase [Myxococcota bacterium]
MDEPASVEAPVSVLESERPVTAGAAGEETGASRAGVGSGVRLPFGLMVGLFVVSGATGLVDQLCFSKYLGYVVGATAHAVSAVLAAFMTGLALGAHFGGKWSARIRRPLVAYAVLEFVVAVAVALAPLGFRVLMPLYASLAKSAPDSLVLLSGLRWLAALLLVVVPTTAMGATLPFLSRGLEASDPGSEGKRARRLSALYAANTFGGAGGALLAAYWVVPTLGVNGTLFASALASALVGATAGLRGRKLVVAPLARELDGSALDANAPTSDKADSEPTLRTGDDPASQEVKRIRDELRSAHERVATRAGTTQAEPSLQERARLAALAFSSGALVFAAEVVFTHLLALIIGNSAYAFGLILAAFLSSLFIGATLAGPLERRLGSGALALGLVATTLAVLGTLPVWDDLPRLFASSGEAVTSFEGREAVRGLTALAVLLVPTSLMGLTFPLLLRRVAGYRGMGSWVGRLTAINTLGAVAGALGTGYVVLPLLGSQSSLVAIGFGFGLSALVTLGWTAPRVRSLTLGGVGLGLVCWLASPRWDLANLTSGANVYFEGHKTTQELVSIREDVHGGVTTVARAEGVYTLYTNGKFQGNTGWEMNAQRFFAHYPSIFVKHFDETLVIGLGTGTTLGTLATYPWKSIDVAEISPSIVDAARAYFKSVNLGALDDPRVHLEHADGRNFLLVSERKYDLISMELSSIWFAGASSLYSDEFYRLASAHLKPGAVFQQWVQLHHIYKKDFATIVHTLRRNFRHVVLFYGGGQGILLASDSPLQASRARLAELQKRRAVIEVLPFERPLEALVDDVLVLDEGLDAFLRQAAAEVGESIEDWVSTDENLYLEYATPRGNVLPWSAREALVAELRGFRDPSRVAALLVP